AVGSATTFQTLPSPLPVLSACQPVGTLPTSSLPRRKPGALSWASATAPVSASSAATLVHRIVPSPLKQRNREQQLPPLSLSCPPSSERAPRERKSSPDKACGDLMLRFFALSCANQSSASTRYDSAARGSRDDTNPPSRNRVTRRCSSFIRLRWS